jgi:hypothetical protein
MLNNLDYKPSPGRLILRRLYKAQQEKRWLELQPERDLWAELTAMREELHPRENLRMPGRAA